VGKPRQITRPLAVLWRPRWGVLRPDGLPVTAGRMGLGLLSSVSSPHTGQVSKYWAAPTRQTGMKNSVNLRAASTTRCGAWLPHRPHPRLGVASRRAVVSIPNSSSVGSPFPRTHLGKPICGHSSLRARLCVPISACRFGRVEDTPAPRSDGQCPCSVEQGHCVKASGGVPPLPQSFSDRLWLPDLARPRAST
jgi:hypothetical protein